MNRRSPFRRVVASAVVVFVVFGLGACGDDDDAAAGDEETTTTTRPTTTESDVEPPGTEPAEVQPYIEDLLSRYSDIVSQIVADPAVAADPQHSLYNDLRALMAPDSTMAEPIVAALVERGERGVSQRPFEDDPPVVRELDGEIETVSADEVSFLICTRQSYRLFDAQGQQTEYADGLAQPGRGTAVRVDGHWFIERFDVLDAGDDCPGDQQ